MKHPTPEQIREARQKAGLSIAASAKLVHGSRSAWHRWEDGSRKMPLAAWELFLLKSSK